MSVTESENPKTYKDAMKSGETLEVFLDDGVPIDNVPGSVVNEGHEVLKKERVGEHWSVLIEKA